MNLYNTKLYMVMSQTNTNTEDGHIKQCPDTKRGRRNQEGSCGVCLGNRNCNSNRGNSSFTNYSFGGKLEDNCASNFTITIRGPRSNQLKKILDVLPDFCQDKHYKYINDIISTNTKPTQAYFLLAYPV